MHDYEALHYDKEQLKEACEWLQGWGGGCGGEMSSWGTAWDMQTCSQLLKGLSVLQLCLWELWWSPETVTWSTAAPKLRDSSR